MLGFMPSWSAAWRRSATLGFSNGMAVSPKIGRRAQAEHGGLSHFQLHDGGTAIRACAIDPYCERGAGWCLFFLFPHMREGAERRVGASVTSLTPRERRRVLLRSSTRASRRSTAAIFYTATALLGLERRHETSRYPGGIC